MDRSLEVKINICLTGKVLLADRTKIVLEENKNNYKIWA